MIDKKSGNTTDECENEWSGSIDASKGMGAMKRIEAEEVRCETNRMKTAKAK